MSHDAGITRRDVINGVLAGAGAMLVGPARAPAATSPPPGADWSGYGGVGDYARSNGNTAAVVRAGHAVRDGTLSHRRKPLPGDGPLFDVVIVGAGLAGLHAAYELMRLRGRSCTCLLLDNHPIFGGEAKQNEFLVDGHRLHAPQGSNDFLVPTQGYLRTVWDELGVAGRFEFAPRPPGVPDAPLENFGPMYWQPDRTPVGYYFRDAARGGRGKWVIDPWKDGFARAPIPAALRRDLRRLWTLRDPPLPQGDFTSWLDSMTYGQFLLDVLGLDPGVTAHVDPLLAASNYGFGSDVISAYAAYYSWMPGVRAYLPFAHLQSPSSPALLSFPGGNSAIARLLVRRMLPEAIEGPATFAGTLEDPVRFDALDREDAWLRIRLESTVMRVAHTGAAETSREVSITYFHDGQIRQARGKAVVMATGAWINRRVLADAPAPLRAALEEFHHGPMLVVNVALRHWRFLARLGFTSARWFEGFGFFANIRRPMIVGGRSAPFHPDEPIVLTLYVPVMARDGDIRAQGARARQELLSRRYSDYESAIRSQLTALFGAAGFDPDRDIAGIILNRWGHAYIAPQPGFLLGRGGRPPPLEVVRRGYGRICFGHSELAGAQNWPNAASEGARAARQAVELLQ